ncbi:MAG TPA: hypothetical protein VFQ22_11420 [Longimicrobiales bacterium]|nr:hypothetical protein [Longimicrobiales bacterium]
MDRGAPSGGASSGAPARRPGRAGRVPTALLATLLVTGLEALAPPPAASQLTSPCELACGAVLAASAAAASTGTLVAVARLTGGFARTEQGVALWGGTLVLLTGGAVALAEDGERQRSAVYGAGLGTLAGAAAGLALASLRAGDADDRLAGALIGGGAGALLGGIAGALSGGDDGPPHAGVPLLSIRLAF